MRFLFILFVALVSGFLLLEVSGSGRDTEKPVFLRIDELARNHHTKIDLEVHAPYRPTDIELTRLKEDYGNIWAHLNHLYATNDVEQGKEYYTEAWFQHLCRHYSGPRKPLVTRTDLYHKLLIQNWANDGLVCTAIDSNIVLQYQYPDLLTQASTAHIALVLLYQGDHWRIDAIRVLDETFLEN